MPPRKPPKRLFKSKDVIHAYEHDRATKGGLKRMVRDHLDVLQNIEFGLVHCANEDPSIDDSTIAQALRCCIRGTELGDEADPRVVQLCDSVMQMRDLREDVSEELWATGLRTVLGSVKDHSTLQPGDKSYLKFVGEYVR